MNWLLYLGLIVPALFVALLMLRVCRIEPVTEKKLTISLVVGVFILGYLWLFLLACGLVWISRQ